MRLMKSTDVLVLEQHGIFLLKDDDGLYLYCLACGHIRNMHVFASTQKTLSGLVMCHCQEEEQNGIQDLPSLPEKPTPSSLMDRLPWSTLKLHNNNPYEQ